MGLGTLLGVSVADAARERGIHRFTATLLGDNLAAHRLLERISERLHVRHDGALDEIVGELAA
jgi:RimJ/RimL family protein N-acetyltransferase